MCVWGWGAHPRSRGENRGRRGGPARDLGSSPLTRGKQKAVQALARKHGLIPAHAGKTTGRPTALSLPRAHPRSRGENLNAGSASTAAAGSSPLTRGKRPGHRSVRVQWPAHPRSRGENQSKQTRSPACAGSSPLTRGKRTRRACSASGWGLIPAHAGKTHVGIVEANYGGAHPRSRGENICSFRARMSSTGSSPLTRGKREPRAPLLHRHGLIPAHAGKTPPDTSSSPSRTAHPRSRGENPHRKDQDPCVPGSSPLTRGKRIRQIRTVAGRRLIPAHAGKTRRPPRARSTSTAHPRSRGENGVGGGRVTMSVGSSPLTRGKHQSGGRRRRRMGLIPAHAGKTPGSRSTGLSAWAHPRSRGENTCLAGRTGRRAGSSPLTRGKPATYQVTAKLGGLIPAHAGKTALAASPSGSWRAHPRSRGENSTPKKLPSKLPGSSPLTRGKPGRVPRGMHARGLIPAHAGKTSWNRRPTPTARAHPRSRGENLTGRQGLGKSWGSSPLTRGKRRSQPVDLPGDGLIPAHAGKTYQFCEHNQQPKAHPRSRGENIVSRIIVFTFRGSSPLTRGKRAFRRVPRGHPGLIPAHAGKTT